MSRFFLSILCVGFVGTVVSANDASSVTLPPNPYEQILQSTGPQSAVPYADRESDYQGIAKTAKAMAQRGDASAQELLGEMYYFGRGVPQNYEEAVKYLRLAAEQGRADAQFKLGVMYSYGKGVAQDNTLSAFWWEKAAAQGNADAKSQLSAITKAALDHAVGVFKHCQGQSVSRLDDALSPADVIAIAVISSCRQELDAFRIALNPAAAASREFIEGFEQGAQQDTTRIVLEYRAAKRQVQDRQDGSLRSSPSRPKTIM